MKVITVSRTFPAYHPKAGQPTFFVEKILASVKPSGFNYKHLCDLNNHTIDDDVDRSWDFWNSLQYHPINPKHHTIRSGHRFKTGDMASLRVWSGKPYNSKQITFAEVTVICFDFELKCVEGYSQAIVNTSSQPLSEVAVNDGLEEQDLLDWFKYPKPFTGQIICWIPKITY